MSSCVLTTLCFVQTSLTSVTRICSQRLQGPRNVADPCRTLEQRGWPRSDPGTAQSLIAVSSKLHVSCFSCHFISPLSPQTSQSLWLTKADSAKQWKELWVFKRAGWKKHSPLFLNGAISWVNITSPWLLPFEELLLQPLSHLAQRANCCDWASVSTCCQHSWILGGSNLP